MPVAWRSKLTHVIVGVDEAGRGPLAGPVAAGACVLPLRRRFPTFITDSKLLTPLIRERAFAWIERHCLYGVGFVEASEIDRCGILAATERAMQMAVRSLAERVTPTYLLIDGCDHFWFDYPHTSIVRGDESERCIGAASIVAKVLRDRLMQRLARQYPQYGFLTNVGYGTAEHIAALQCHGPCELHRMSFLTEILSVRPFASEGLRRAPLRGIPWAEE